MDDVGLKGITSVVVSFVFYWVACEKVAKVIVAMERNKSTIGSDFQSKNWFRTNELIAGHKTLELERVISLPELNLIFLKKATASRPLHSGIGCFTILDRRT